MAACSAAALTCRAALHKRDAARGPREAEQAGAPAHKRSHASMQHGSRSTWPMTSRMLCMLLLHACHLSVIWMFASCAQCSAAFWACSAEPYIAWHCVFHIVVTQIYGLNRDPRLPVPDYHKKPKGWWSNPRKACSRMMLPLLPLTANMSTVLCGHFARAEGQCGGRAALLAEIQAIRQDLVSDAHA